MRMRRFELKFSRERGGSQGRREEEFCIPGRRLRSQEAAEPADRSSLPFNTARKGGALLS